MKKRIGVTIQIENLTIPQAIALEKMFDFMEYLAAIGSSRWVAYYSDGDGDFNPKVTFSTEEPLPKSEKKVKRIGDTAFYGLDFDAIAWELREDNK